MSNPQVKQPWESHDPYSLDIPKHTRYLFYEQTNALDQLVYPAPQELQQTMLRAYQEIKALHLAVRVVLSHITNLLLSGGSCK